MYWSLSISNLAVTINCEWGSWITNDECSSSCGEGTLTKKRSIKVQATHGGKCSGKNTMTVPCNLKNCPSKRLILVFHTLLYCYWFAPEFIIFHYSLFIVDVTQTPPTGKPDATRLTTPKPKPDTTKPTTPKPKPDTTKPTTPKPKPTTTKPKPKPGNHAV